MRTIRWKTLVALAAALVVFGAGWLAGANKPESVIHVVTVNWKDGAEPAQIQAALDGVEKLADSFDGISRVWVRSIKAQGMAAAFVMEFTSEQALVDYAGSDAQKEWYKSYIPVRGQSRTFDITN